MKESLNRRKLLGFLSGPWISQSLYALVKLGVPERMADGPVHVGQLAHDCGADVRALGRLLRALALMGLFTEPAPDTYGLTPTTDLLRADVPGSVRLNVLMQGDEVYRSFAEIVHTLRTGRPAFEAVYGRSFYDYLGDNPEAAAIFNESMADEKPPEALAGCDLSWAGTVVDVGGGNGGLLIELLTRHPHLHGVLLELSDAAEAARARFAEAGLAERTSCVAGSFFDGVPAGGHAYVLARVLHNWNDENAVAILRHVHAALPEYGRLIVLEDFLPEGVPAGRSAAGVVDLLMLVTLEGRDRTETEYRELLGKAGFEVVESRDGVLEGRVA